MKSRPRKHLSIILRSTQKKHRKKPEDRLQRYADAAAKIQRTEEAKEGKENDGVEEFVIT